MEWAWWEQWLIGLDVPVKFSTGYDTAGNKRTELAAINTWWNDYYNVRSVDGLGRVTSITQQWLGAHAVANKRVEFAYDLAGRRDWVKRYASTGTTNEVASTDYTWDLAGRLTTIDHRQGSTPGSGTQKAGYSYTWNQRQELTVSDFLPSAYNGEDVSYDYDARSQLVSANYTSQADDTYQWDDNGNRTNGGFTPGVNNRLASDSTYTYVYGNEGNLTRRTKISGTEPDGTKTREFSWDHRNRLLTVTNKNTSNGEINRVEYAYDGDDHMIRRQVFLGGSSTPTLHQVFAYSDGQITLQFEKTGGGAVTRTDLAHRYLWGPAVDELLADEDINSLTNAGLNTLLWPLTDHLGTIRDWINNSATVVDHVEYDSFGKRLDTAAVDAAFGWTGRYRDPVTGLQYNNARWYDPATQRWLSEDFIWDGANKYSYVGNTPTKYIDPNGFAATEPRQGYLGGVIDVMQGYGDAAVGTVKGGWFIIRHPIQTAKGVGTAIAHPIQTGQTIWNDVCEKSETVRGQASLVGDVLVGLATGGAVKVASKSATVVRLTSRTNPQLVDDIAERAARWGDRRGLQPSGVAGSLQHDYAKRLLRRYQDRLGNRGLSTEVRYVNGRPWRTGDPCKGSVLLDVVEGAKANPIRVYDYKFWEATLEQRRLEQIYGVSGIPTNVPIIVVKPKFP